ncbi:hypothetical protein T03_6014, partial [Trichinella britovi]
MLKPDGTIPSSEHVIKVMLVNWVVNADFYLLASYSLPVYMNYNINLQWNEHRAVSTDNFMKKNYFEELYNRCSIGSGSAKSRQVKQLSLTRLFSAESLGFPRSREGERALRLLKEQGRVCTLPCLREGSFTLQDGAHFWSLHPPPALNISSTTLGMFAILQNSFMPDFICLSVLHCTFITKLFFEKCFINKELLLLLLLHCS